MKKRYLIISILGLIIVGIGIFSTERKTNEIDNDENTIKKIEEESTFNKLKIRISEIEKDEDVYDVFLIVTNTDSNKKENISIKIMFYDEDNSVIDDIDLFIDNLDEEETGQWVISTNKNLSDVYSYSVVYENTML